MIVVEGGWGDVSWRDEGEGGKKKVVERKGLVGREDLKEMVIGR